MRGSLIDFQEGDRTTDVFSHFAMNETIHNESVNWLPFHE